MNKKYTLEIEPIQFDNMGEVAQRFATLMAELTARAMDSGEFEEEEKGLGFKVEINLDVCYLEDGYLKGRIGGKLIDWRT